MKYTYRITIKNYIQKRGELNGSKEKS